MKTITHITIKKKKYNARHTTNHKTNQQSYLYIQKGKVFFIRKHEHVHIHINEDNHEDILLYRCSAGEDL